MAVAPCLLSQQLAVLCNFGGSSGRFALSSLPVHGYVIHGLRISTVCLARTFVNTVIQANYLAPLLQADDQR